LPVDIFGAPFLTAINDGHGPDVETWLDNFVKKLQQNGSRVQTQKQGRRGYRRNIIIAKDRIK
jgi:hypothetical protein